MMKSLSPKKQEQRRLQQHLLTTLQQLSPPPPDCELLPPQAEWPSTRQLADTNDISIYKARNLLLDMAKNGKVMVTGRPVNNTLRWYPSYRDK
jgi:hypothetical protein